MHGRIVHSFDGWITDKGSALAERRVSYGLARRVRDCGDFRDHLRIQSTGVQLGHTNNLILPRRRSTVSSVRETTNAFPRIVKAHSLCPTLTIIMRT